MENNIYILIIVLLAAANIITIITSVKDRKTCTNIIGKAEEMVSTLYIECCSLQAKAGITQEQIDNAKNNILLMQGKELNEMQVLSILIAYRKSMENQGQMWEFIADYIKEHNW